MRGEAPSASVFLPLGRLSVSAYCSCLLERWCAGHRFSCGTYERTGASYRYKLRPALQLLVASRNRSARIMYIRNVARTSTSSRLQYRYGSGYVRRYVASRRFASLFDTLVCRLHCWTDPRAEREPTAALTITRDDDARRCGNHVEKIYLIRSQSPFVPQKRVAYGYSRSLMRRRRRRRSTSFPFEIPAYVDARTCTYCGYLYLRSNRHRSSTYLISRVPTYRYPYRIPYTY